MAQEVLVEIREGRGGDSFTEELGLDLDQWRQRLDGGKGIAYCVEVRSWSLPALVRGTDLFSREEL